LTFDFEQRERAKGEPLKYAEILGKRKPPRNREIEKPREEEKSFWWLTFCHFVTSNYCHIHTHTHTHTVGKGGTICILVLKF